MLGNWWLSYINVSKLSTIVNVQVDNIKFATISTVKNKINFHSKVRF